MFAPLLVNELCCSTALLRIGTLSDHSREKGGMNCLFNEFLRRCSRQGKRFRSSCVCSERMVPDALSPFEDARRIVLDFQLASAPSSGKTFSQPRLPRPKVAEAREAAKRCSESSACGMLFPPCPAKTELFHKLVRRSLSISDVIPSFFAVCDDFS